MAKQKTNKDPLVNCHTHIFTSGHIPPYLAKTYLPAPFHKILHLHFLLKIYRWFARKAQEEHYGYNNVKARRKYVRQMFIRRNVVLRTILNLIGAWFTLQALFIIGVWVKSILEIETAWWNEWIGNLRDWMSGYNLICPTNNIWTKILIVGIVLLLFKSGRNLILFIAKKVAGTIVKLPGKETKELLNRYLLIGKHAVHKTQRKSFDQLRSQYPEGSKFVVLPMDMHYMDAGDPPVDYKDQLEELKDLKKNPKLRDHILPFVFADPRRIAEEKDYFSYKPTPDGGIELNPCTVKTYIEEFNFTGIKIYPALGYFPFDKNLLPLWKYTADRGLPIMTHCIRGTIFYRGKKSKDWDFHPVFKQSEGSGNYQPLLLDYKSNLEFQEGFTHPLNYLCLLREPFLRILIGQYNDQDLKKLFGYNGPDKPMDQNLEHLKICFAHFGGDDEWFKYLERDRDNMSLQLTRYPMDGITLFDDSEDLAEGRMLRLWRHGDWYSILCTLMLDYENVYSDISYILENEEIAPLLKRTLDPIHGKLRDKVLFGTDFYVVRNHHSEKDLLYRLLSALSEEEFDLIARVNPKKYLNLP